MSEFATYYTGQDIVFTIDMKTVTFANAADITVDVYNNDTIIKTLKKTETDPLKQILAVSGQPTRALVRVFVGEVAAMVSGYVRAAITVKTNDAAFPSGRNDKYFGTIAKFEKL